LRAASAGTPLAGRRVRVALASIVVLAAALRFSTLGVQSYWLDEAFSVHIAKLSFADVFAQVKRSEGSPPLYYYLAWLWRHAFGTSEFGLRSLSALIGTATVPAAFYAARELVSERAGLVTALLVALNPWLIWYSQEARTYALLVLLSTVALAFFARALRTGGRRDVLLWVLFAGLAMCAHYFAAFLALPEAALLLWSARRERRDARAVLLSVAGLAALGVPLLALALAQRKGNEQGFIRDLPRSTRLEDIVRHPLAGELGGPVHGFVQAAAVLALAAVALLVTRSGPRERRGALVAFGVGAGALAIPVAASFVHSLDYFLARNSLAVVVPFLIAIAAGLAVPRGGWIAAATLAGLCALWMAVNVSIPLDAKLQRDDWRGAVHALGPPAQPRVVATTPDFLRMPLTTYLHPAVPLGPAGATASELDLIRLRRGSAAAKQPVAIPGLAPFSVKRTVSYELDRYRAPGPVRITPATLAAIGPTAAAFVQP
jgi:mannosyltransferase